MKKYVETLMVADAPLVNDFFKGDVDKSSAHAVSVFNVRLPYLPPSLPYPPRRPVSSRAQRDLAADLL